MPDREVFQYVTRFLRQARPTPTVVAPPDTLTLAMMRDADRRRRLVGGRAGELAQRFPLPVFQSVPEIAQAAARGGGRPSGVPLDLPIDEGIIDLGTPPPRGVEIPVPGGGGIDVGPFEPEPPGGVPEIPSPDVFDFPPFVPGGGGPIIGGGIDVPWGGPAAEVEVVERSSNPNSRPRYFDDYFNGPRLSTEWTEKRGSWVLSVGQLLCTSATGATPDAILGYNRFVYTDCFASVVCIDLAGTHGVFARGTLALGPFSGYAMLANGASSSLVRYVADVPTVLGVGSGILAGQSIGISVQGVGVKGWIDSAVAISAVDPTLTGGYAGVLLDPSGGADRFDTFHSYPL